MENVSKFEASYFHVHVCKITMQSLYDDLAILNSRFQGFRFIKTLYEHDGCIGTLSKDLYYHPRSNMFVVAKMKESTIQNVRIVQCQKEIADYIGPFQM